MPLDLTDVDAFTSPVTVPEDGDDRDSLSVQGTFQALADRTRNNKNRLDGLEAAAHTWSGVNTFSQNPVLSGTTEIVYSGARTRMKVVPLAAALLRDHANALLNNGAGDLYIATAASFSLTNQTLTFGLNPYMSRVGTFTGINVMWDPASAGSMSAKLYKKTLSFDIPYSSTVSAALASITSAVTDLTVDSSGISQAFDTSTEEWTLDIKATAGLNTLLGVRIIYSELVATGG